MGLWETAYQQSLAAVAASLQCSHLFFLNTNSSKVHRVSEKDVEHLTTQTSLFLFRVNKSNLADVDLNHCNVVCPNLSGIGNFRTSWKPIV